MTYPIYTDRYIDISAKTRVGFNYIKQQFYVTNIDSNNIPYTTYRDTLEDIKDVLGALNIVTTTTLEKFTVEVESLSQAGEISTETIGKALKKIHIKISDEDLGVLTSKIQRLSQEGEISTETIKGALEAIGVTTITDSQLEALVTTPEQLTKVSYTLQDVGAYIHTIQFNDFKDYPLTIDCEKAKLYIMNTSIIFDLTLNESPRHVRVPRILSYYREKLGLRILEDDMRYFYSLLVFYYHPTCYNQVALNQDTGKYFYNNKFLLSNFDNTSKATYTCTYNPNNNAEEIQIGYVDKTDTATSTIRLAESIQVSALEGYGRIILKGAEATMEDTDTTYSADGEYIIDSLIVDEEDENTITGFKVSNTIPYSYEFPYKECYVLSAQYTITKMNSASRVISLSAKPEGIVVGDIILVSGASVPTPHETISCNGSYTVLRIGTVNADGTANPNSIEVEEEIPTDFTAGAGDNAILLKEVFIGNIKSINNKVITLTEPTEQDLENSTIFIHTIEDGITNIENYPVASFSTTEITVTGDVQDYTPAFPALYIPIPNPAENAEVLIDVTSVTESAQKKLPLGEFIVDSFEECQNYIRTVRGLVVPSDSIKNNLYMELGETLPLEATIPDLTTPASKDKIPRPDNISEMEFKGLYSDIYSEG